MIDLDRFDNWPRHVDVTAPERWPHHLLFDVFDELTHIRAGLLNPLEYVMIEHAYSLVKPAVDDYAARRPPHTDSWSP